MMSRAPGCTTSSWIRSKDLCIHGPEGPCLQCLGASMLLFHPENLLLCCQPRIYGSFSLSHTPHAPSHTYHTHSRTLTIIYTLYTLYRYTNTPLTYSTHSDSHNHTFNTHPTHTDSHNCTHHTHTHTHICIHSQIPQKLAQYCETIL